MLKDLWTVTGPCMDSLNTHPIISCLKCGQKRLNIIRYTQLVLRILHFTQLFWRLLVYHVEALTMLSDIETELTALNELFRNIFKRSCLAACPENFKKGSTDKWKRIILFIKACFTIKNSQVVQRGFLFFQLCESIWIIRNDRPFCFSPLYIWSWTESQTFWIWLSWPGVGSSVGGLMDKLLFHNLWQILACHQMILQDAHLGKSKHW